MPCWRITRGSRLLLRSWDDDEVVVYNTLSADTHVLDSLTGEVLKILIDSSPVTEEHIAGQIRQRLEVARNQDSPSFLSGRLNDLCHLGLIESEPQ